MDVKQVRRALLALAILAVAGCNATAISSTPPNREGGAAQTRTTLTLALGEEEAEAALFADAVRRVSNDSIAIDVKAQWREGEPEYETGLIGDVKAGKADIGMVGIRAFDKAGITTFQGLMAPFLIDSYALQERVLESELARDLLTELRPAGLVGIGYRFEALRRPIGLTRDFTSVEDFEGARFGIRASAVSEMTIEALGAEPVVPRPGDVTGLDGLEGSLGTAREYIDRVGSMTSDIVLWPRTYALVVNAGTFDKLTPAQQQILTGAADAAFQESVELVQAYAAELHGVVCASGLPFVEAEEASVSRLREAVEPVYAELEKDPRTKEVIAAVNDLRGPTRTAEPIPPCPSGEPEPSAGGPSPIDGVWTTSFTKDELVNSPLLMDAGEVNDQNWGDFTLTMADGGVVFEQTNPVDHYSTVGTFAVEDDVVIFRYTTGGNAGETFRMRWALFEGTLVFERDPGGIAPTPYVLKAWTRER